MARYLNPTKICHLVLLELYIEGSITGDAVLPVISLILSNLMEPPPIAGAPEPSEWDKVERTVSSIVSIKDFEKLLGSYPFVMGMPGRRLWDQFLAGLWGINSLDALNDFFENLPRLFTRTKEEQQRLSELEEPEEEEGIKLSYGSPFGLFVRRACNEYHRLQFHDCAELWKNFVQYRQPTAHYLKRKLPGFGRLSFDNVLLIGEREGWEHEATMDLVSVVYGDMLEEDQTSTLAVTTHDIESLLEFQIAQMQKFGNRVPREISDQFDDLLHDSHIIPSLTHYLRFLDSWRAGDFPSAFEALHRYFDYTMHNKDRKFYQYALMSLAVLQADFGCYKDAVSAMLEAVTTARENQDMTCLNFALNWLFNFGRAHPSLVEHLESQSLLGSAKESLAFLRVKARETGMWSLWGAVLLTEAKVGLHAGESVATAWEFMVRSSQVTIENNMKPMFGSYLSLASAVFDRLGLSLTGNMLTELYLECYAKYSLFDEKTGFICRASNQLMNRGKYDEALENLDSLDKNALRSWTPSQMWHKQRGIIRLRRLLYHNDLDSAQHLLSQLMQSKMDDIEPDITFQLDALEVDYMTRRGDFQAAAAKIDAMMADLRDTKQDVTCRVRLLLMKAALLDKCGRPLRGFSIAMRAADISWKTRIIPSLWHAIGAIANILVCLGEFEAASSLLLAILPRSLESDAVSISAQLYVYLVDANMGLAGKQEPGSHKRKEYMTRAFEAAQGAFDRYSILEDIKQQCRLTAKKAMIMKLSGDTESAEDYAARYAALQEKAETYRLGERGDAE